MPDACCVHVFHLAGSNKDVGPGGWRPGEDPRGPDGWRPGDRVAPRRGELEPTDEIVDGNANPKPKAKVQMDTDDDPSQSVAGKAGTEVTGFVYSRGFKKTPFVKVEWNEKLKDHDLGPTYGLDPRQKRNVAAGRRAKRLPLSSQERQLHGPRDLDDGAGGVASGSQQSRELEPVDAMTLLDPTIQLTMPGLKKEENDQLRERVLAKIDTQVAEIQRRLIRRRDKMDKLGFLSQDHNQARVEAMLKLEIRKRIRIDEVKEVVLSEMWQEKAKLEPQEGLFANLEAKLHNILDAVGSVDTVTTQNSRSSKSGVATQKSKASSLGGGGGGGRSSVAEERSGTSRKAEPEPAPKRAPERAPEIPARVLEGATEEDLLNALRDKRAAASDQHDLKIPKQADRVQGPWRDLPEWTTRTQRLRQAGADGDSPKGNDTPRSDSEYGSEYSDEYDAIPMVQMGVPHMFGDNASLHAGELKIKGAEAVAVPEGTDWLLSSPKAGEDYLGAGSSKPRKENTNYQTYDLSKEGNDANVLDDLFGDLDIGLDSIPGLRAAGPVVDGPPAVEADIGGSSAAIGVMDGEDGASKTQYDEQTEWQVAGNRAAAGDVSELYKAAQGSEAHAHQEGAKLFDYGRALPPTSNVGGPYKADDSAVSMRDGRGPSYKEDALREKPAPGGPLLDQSAAKREIQEKMERQAKGRQLRESKKRMPAPAPVPEPSYEAKETQADRDAAAAAGLKPADFEAPRQPSPEPLPPDVQHRLEDVWADLRMPVMAKLDMAVKYTAGGGTTRLIMEALPKWESAASLIKDREAALAVIKESVEFLERGEATRTCLLLACLPIYLPACLPIYLPAD
jgi:hypothetical protein